MNAEKTEVIVVGARCAGSAAAIALATAGRRVIALDSARFPADTLSTHLLWPSGLAELRALGALAGVQALGAPPLSLALAGGAGQEIRTGYPPVDGIDHGMCVRRSGLDMALVDTARRAGAEVREGVKVTELLWDGGRVAGVRYSERGGETGEIRASLVIGADGRRSTVARLAGAAAPYRSAPSGRACFFAYWHDTRPEWRHIAAQWRAGPQLGTAFPCDDGLVLCLLQPPAEDAPRFRGGNAEAAYRATIADIPPLAARLAGCTLVGKVRSATGIESYFRRSSGPGWALPGDAGHFKDPVTAQGIRDALRYGRLLGETAAPVLDDPAALDQRLLDWERAREHDCLDVYQWTNTLARGEPMNALETELYRYAQRHPPVARKMLEVFSRVRRPAEFLSLPQTLLLTARALTRPGGGFRDTLTTARRELATTITDWRERRHARRTPLR
ncbi:NAD(P)/FAD-dependent oxidoreductase [Amycolatopsis anabasis]|uniref:NAD(P)/FAD-dependent oxidoreductase n=1 Tax=Amycolatopsis anabasis TaxID=1840409 RepID=UPI00131A846F|nr:FAD-dependent monooxygenase [Amycolatopsis anabasis]